MLIHPLGRLLIADPDLDGSLGLNRAPLNSSEPVVNTDIDAAMEFLRIHAATPTTQRNYTKEIERLILWSINVKKKPFSSLSYRDAEEFIGFLSNPDPVEQWASLKKFPRESSDWRPFVARKEISTHSDNKEKVVAGISPSSQLLSMAILSSFFAWLVDYNYLSKNPMRQLKVLRKAIRAKDPKAMKPKVERYLDEEMLASLHEAVEMMSKDTQSHQDQYERAVFIVALMLFLAPRAHELAAGAMNDFKADGKLWWWNVVGKGSVAAQVPVVEGMLEALIRYRTHLGLSPLPLPDDNSPLLRSVRTGKPITTRQLNLILDELFEAAAKLLLLKADALPASDIIARAEYQTRAAKIRKASSHWGRHTSITMQIRSGIPKDIVQKNARHSDSRTTDGYTHEDQEYWHSQSQKMHK